MFVEAEVDFNQAPDFGIRATVAAEHAAKAWCEKNPEWIFTGKWTNTCTGDK